jgi:uncharacterized membrane protein YagU involved in acid resistance
MADTATQTTARTDSTIATWQAGTVAGIAGGVLMGIMLTVQMTPVIEMAIPAMYGLTGGLAGWVAHLAHSAILGVAFAAILVGADATDRSIGATALAGGAYGIVLWAVLAVLVMPIWLQTVGFANAPALPNISVMSLVGHVVYGLATGVAFAFVR